MRIRMRIYIKKYTEYNLIKRKVVKKRGEGKN